MLNMYAEKIKEVFTQDLAQLPGFEHRDQQLDMALMVYHGLLNRRHVLAEAGTGTGKSLAALIPAIFYLQFQKQTVPETDHRPLIISTATINLQGQYFQKDIPFLEALFVRMGIVFKSALAKGRSNYLCSRRLGLAVKNKLLGRLDPKPLLDNAFSGDKLDCPPVFLPHWNKVCSDDGCLVKKCGFYQSTCPYRKAKKEWQQADLVVTNHYLVARNLDLLKKTQRHVLLPHPCGYIFDEAHHLEDTMRDSFGTSLSNESIPYAAQQIGSLAPGIGLKQMETLLEDNKALFQAIRAPLSSMRRQDLTLPSGIWMHYNALTSSISRLVDRAMAAKEHVSEEDAESLSQLIPVIQNQREHLERILKMKDKDSFVYWMEPRQSKRVFLTLNESPIDVSPYLEQTLFAKTPCTLTSATLSTNSSYDHIKTSLGMPDELCDERIFSSPFNFRQNSVLYVPNLPDLKTRPDDHAKASIEEIRVLLQYSRGKCLVLCTTYRFMKAAHEALRSMTYPMKYQGEDSRENLLSWFKSTPDSVLFATQSFWEGIDVPGQELSLVIIDRLPFDVPVDPIVKAIYQHIDKNGGSSFMDRALPKTALRLKQGFGRLIRKKTDKGVVAVLDPRLAEARYSKFLIHSLPDCKRTRKRLVIQSYLKSVVAPLAGDSHAS